MDGIFSINKPVGMTSHDVVARVRRLTRHKRVGHTGTLDPAASGVLPICIGVATRFVEYLSDAPKAYRAEVQLGVVTDTYDAEGQVIRQAEVPAYSREELEAALEPFRGAIEQVPPIYSALKQGGQPLYKLVRAGVDVKVTARRVVITRLSIIAWQHPLLTLEVECSKGTYIRSLAFDLGEKLGCGAHVYALQRTRSGPFTLAETLTLEELERAVLENRWHEVIFAADETVLHHEAIIVNAVTEQRLRMGLNLPLPPTDDEIIRAYSLDGRFIGILIPKGPAGIWHPHKIVEVPLYDKLDEVVSL